MKERNQEKTHVCGQHVHPREGGQNGTWKSKYVTQFFQNHFLCCIGKYYLKRNGWVSFQQNFSLFQQSICPVEFFTSGAKYL